ncbi:MAG: PQQ-binding-like beta-propeller repeat protein [Actinobacteria bacterium]|nr:PQQ-binding-like beta-propeller repeat protein [Actinomycetota bacterium]MBV8480664.1 PQQ-binding-like beta-propeller repeat protein [Actinomycetota bacterium]
MAITPSPAWSDAQLSAPAGNDWLLYYGDLSGDRYSSLNQINTSNVSQLKQVWQMSLGTCTASIIAGNPVVPGANPGAANNPTNCGSMESNPVAVNGVLYTINAPLGQVFAIDAATGNIIWEYTPSYAGETLLSGAVYSPGSGGRLPGVAVAEGRVYAGLPDGRLIALDQTTGGLLWENNIGSYKLGNRISTAPIYVEGMVIVGDGAGDNGGPDPNLTAYSATSGARIWSFNPIPQVGQPGYNTWSNKDGNGSVAFGGGAFWESPLVDTKLGTLFIGTGNPEPWNSRGAGEDLYTCSIVALNLHTGQMKWYFQQVHHDMWDSDLPNNGVLFNGTFKFGGKTVTAPAVAYVNKVGMTFVLDQRTGKPLIPVKETPVPQDSTPGVNTWPTQPVPATQNVLFNPIGKDGIPCTTPDALTSAGVPYATATAPDGKPFHIGCAYTPYDTTQYTVMPFEMMDWPASSYAPSIHSMVTCGVTGRATAMEQIPPASQVAGVFGGLGANRLGVADGSSPLSNSGNFTALNVETGKYTWHQHWQAICYSGSANTAGGITFVGHFGTGNGINGDGYLEAVDTKTGASLWTSPTMPYPVSAAPIVYTVNGKEYVTVEDGGSGHNDVTRPAGLLAPQRIRGDYVYTFALP